MEALGLAAFEAEAEAYDALALAAPEIDRFCSASEWVLAAREAWTPDARPWIRRGAHGWAVLLEHPDPSLGMLMGWDSMWGFSCPLVGRDGPALAREFEAACRDEPWQVLLLPGLRPRSALLRAVAECFRGSDLRQGGTLRRWAARLDGGLKGYLGRRPRKLRENLRRAGRRARALAVTFEEGAGTVETLLERILDVERRSWKGPAATGLLMPDMYAFYEVLAHRLARRGRLRTLFARRGGQDVGYILGGVRDGIYRGFQFSFDRRYGALSLGSLLQLAQIEELCAAGLETYDLGIDMPYKRHWADAPVDTITLVILK